MRIIFLFCFFICAFVGLAQQKILKVTVRDANSHQALPFANMYLKEMAVGATADTSGHAGIKLKEALAEDSLIVTYFGYISSSTFINLFSNLNVEVELRPDEILMQEVRIQATDSPDPVELIKKAIKYTNQNYSDSDVVLNCFYRETVFEEGKCIQLNDALTEVYYSSYPQKDLDPNMWKDWYYDDEYAFNIEADYMFYELLHDFNAKQDKMRIIESRSSENWSAYGVESAVMGGPLGLTSFDKLKYQNDFLNPKLLDKYRYELTGTSDLNDSKCYVISFHPEITEKNFVIDQSRKNKSAIYVGKIYIDKESFAVAKFEYRLAVERDFGFFEKSVPLEYAIEVNYRKNNEIWYLDNVNATELKAVTIQRNKKTVCHEGKRELFVQSYQKTDIKPFEDSTVFKSTRISAIRYYPKDYHESAWVNYPISGKIKDDLESKKKLNDQFKSRYLKKENLSPPVANTEEFMHEYPECRLRDDYHWMSITDNSPRFLQYLDEENKYAKNELLNDRHYQNKLFKELNNVYLKETETNKFSGKEFEMDTDPNGKISLYRNIDSLHRIEILDISNFQLERHVDFLKAIVPNEDRTFFYLRFERSGTIGDFVDFIRIGESIVFDSISNVYTIEWITNQSIVYSKTNRIGRSDELVWHNFQNGEDVVLYRESDLTFDVEVVKKYDNLQCIVQSKSENEVWEILNKIGQPILQLIQARQSNVKYSIVWNNDDCYMLTNANSPYNELLHASNALPFVWTTCVENRPNVFVEDFYLTKDFIVLKSYEKAILRIEYIDKKKGRIQQLKFPEKSSFDATLYANVNSNVIKLFLSNPAKPGSLFTYDLDKEEWKSLESIKLQKPWNSRYITSKLVWTKSYDGVKVPMTILKSAVTVRKHKGTILKVYGAYGAITLPSFSNEDYTLLLQGYTIVYAHVRGESVLGFNWYQDGKLQHKKNSLEDYIACAKYLIKHKITTPEYLVAYGNSAGGLVVGWAINTSPELFNTAVLDHPFLDVLNTLMIDTLPLTIDEYKEWGNPKDSVYFAYIKSYSPYQNIKQHAYPNLIFLAGISDYQTPVCQIASSVASIRRSNVSSNRIVLITDMKSGHMGNTNETERMKSFSQTYSLVKMNLFD